MELSRGIVQDGLGDQCKSASAVTPVLLQTLGKPCGQHCPWGEGVLLPAIPEFGLQHVGCSQPCQLPSSESTAW